MILSNDKQELIRYQKQLRIFSKLYMKLNFSKWFINSMAKPLDFLGYRIVASYKLIRKHSVVRAKRKIKKYRALNEIEKLNKFLASWGGHLRSADSHNLIKFINKEMNNARASI